MGYCNTPIMNSNRGSLSFIPDAITSKDPSWQKFVYEHVKICRVCTVQTVLDKYFQQKMNEHKLFPKTFIRLAIKYEEVAADKLERLSDYCVERFILNCTNSSIIVENESRLSYTDMFHFIENKIGFDRVKSHIFKISIDLDNKDFSNSRFMRLLHALTMTENLMKIMKYSSDFTSLEDAIKVVMVHES